MGTRASTKKATEPNKNRTDTGLNASDDSQTLPKTLVNFSFQKEMAVLKPDYDDIESAFVGLHRNTPNKTSLVALQDYRLTHYLGYGPLGDIIVPQLAKTLLSETPGVAKTKMPELVGKLKSLGLAMSTVSDFQAVHTDFTFGGETEWVRIFFVGQQYKMKELNDELGVKILWSKISYTWKEFENWRLLEDFWSKRKPKILNWMQYEILKKVDDTFGLDKIQETFSIETMGKAALLAKAKPTALKPA